MIFPEGQTHRSMQQNKESRNRSIRYAQVVFDKEAKANKWRGVAFSTNGARAFENALAKKIIKLNLNLREQVSCFPRT